MKIVTSADPAPFAFLGGLGNLVVLVAMIVDLTRRDFR